MKFPEVLVLLAAGTAGGIFSTVAAIASLVTYPALLALGVPPVAANMTNTVSLVFAGASSVAASNRNWPARAGGYSGWAPSPRLGGAAGAAVLLLTPASAFTVVVPVLIGGASLVLLVQPRISLLTPPAVMDTTHRLALGAALFAVAMYVGYFGAAAGVLLLVVLSAMIASRWSGSTRSRTRFPGWQTPWPRSASRCSATCGGSSCSRSRRAS